MKNLDLISVFKTSSFGRFMVSGAMLLAIIPLMSCTKKEMAVDNAAKEGILLMGNGTEPADLDPSIVTGVPEHHIIDAIFEGLVANHPQDLSPQPGVAESWTISKDLKTYTFKLRQNAKWSNGEAVTAKDFVYGWRRILTPSLGAEYSYMLFPVVNAEAYAKGTIKDFGQVGIKAIDDHTLEVKLNAPTPYFLSLLTHYSTFPIHQATVEKFGKFDQRGSKWTRPENIVTNGPFLLKRWEMNKIIVVEKNPSYWDAAAVKLNAIHFFPTESDQSEEKMFRAGELHVTNTIPLNKIDVYKKENPDLIQIRAYLGSYFYRFNTRKAPLNDKRVRLALSMSIDRKSIVERITKGGQIPAYNFTPPSTGGFTPKAKVEYNPEKARQLLAEAGYPEGKNFPAVEILFNTLEAHKTIAEGIQQMWKKELGVNVTLVNQEWKVYLDSEKNGNYFISRAGWIGDYNDANNFLDLWMKDNGNNRTGWSKPEYDKLLQQAASTGDSAKRFEAFEAAEKILSEEAPIMPIYTYTRDFLIRPHLKGWYDNIQDIHPYKAVSLEVVKKQ